MDSTASTESDLQFHIGDHGRQQPANVPEGTLSDASTRRAAIPDCILISDSSDSDVVDTVPTIVSVKRAKTGQKAQAKPSGQDREAASAPHTEGQSREDLEKREAKMTDEKAELDRQRKELEAKYRAFRAREATVVRQAEQLASGQSRLADERSQLDRKTKELKELERDLSSTTAVLTESAKALGELKAKLEADQAELSKQRAIKGPELQEAKATIDRLQEQLAEAIHTRTSTSHKAQTQLDEAHAKLSAKDRDLRQAYERCSALENERDHFRAEKDALRLTIEFRDEQLQLPHHSAPHSSPMAAGVIVKQELADDSTELALASARNAISSTPDTRPSSTSHDPARFPHDVDVSWMLQHVRDELVNEFRGARNAQLTATKYCAFLAENIGRTPDVGRLLEFLCRVEPENAAVVDRIEKKLRAT